jgi:hypothetical protein
VLGNFWPGFHGNVLDAMKVPVEKVQFFLPMPSILHHFIPVSMVSDILGVKVVEMLEAVLAKQFFPSTSSGPGDRVCPR